MTALSGRRAILFDLDGTLVDSTGDITTALNEVLVACGLAPFTIAEVRSLIGDGAALLVHRAFAERNASEPDDALQRFKAHYGEHCLDTTVAYPGMAELVSRLADLGKRIGVVTNKPTGFSVSIVEALGLRVHAVIGPELARAPKPDAEHVLAALARLGASPEEAVVVGDGPTDLLAGRAAGCATVAVTWGNRPRAELIACSPDHVVDDVSELALLLGAGSS